MVVTKEGEPSPVLFGTGEGWGGAALGEGVGVDSGEFVVVGVGDGVGAA